MGRVSKTLLALGCAVVLGSCGSDDQGTIPSGDADALISLLDGIEGDVAAGDCDLAQERAAQFMDTVNALPSEVDDDVKEALRQSADRVIELSADPAQCGQGPTGEDGAQEESSTSSTTTTSTTTDEETTDTETTTDEEAEEPPADEDDGGQTEAEPEPGGGGAGDEPPADEPEVEIGPSDTGGIDSERRAP